MPNTLFTKSGQKKIFFSAIITCLAVVISSCVWQSTAQPQEFLPIDDSEYPYAGLPRIVIETENFLDVKKEHVPAQMQIWDKDSPRTGIVCLTIKARGNSSYKMPKYGYKIKFTDKQEILGMPQNREWALLANFRDKTHLKNFITSQLAENLGDDYAARSQFVELFLNREYLGLYQLSETVKTGKNRVNIKDHDFLLEKTTSTDDKPYFKTNKDNLFEIKNPKNATKEDIEKVKAHIDEFETLIQAKKLNLKQLDNWLDTEDFIRYYWIQELSKNLDGKFQRSIFVTWEQDGIIKMGPVWDFDLGYGIGMVGTTTSPFNWEIKKAGWYKWLWAREDFAQKAKDFWISHKKEIDSILDSISSSAKKIQAAVENDNKRWPVLNSDENLYHEVSYDTYKEAVDSLKSWTKQRINWIDNNMP